MTVNTVRSRPQPRFHAASIRITVDGGEAEGLQNHHQRQGQRQIADQGAEAGIEHGHRTDPNRAHIGPALMTPCSARITCHA